MAWSWARVRMTDHCSVSLSSPRLCWAGWRHGGWGRVCSISSFPTTSIYWPHNNGILEIGVWTLGAGVALRHHGITQASDVVLLWIYGLESCICVNTWSCRLYILLVLGRNPLPCWKSGRSLILLSFLWHEHSGTRLGQHVSQDRFHAREVHIRP